MKKQHHVYCSDVSTARGSTGDQAEDIRRQVLDAEAFSLQSEKTGVFTTFRTETNLDSETNTPQPYVLRLDYHLERLLDSARELEIIDGSSTLHSPDWIRDELRRLLSETEAEALRSVNLRVRLLIRSHDSLEIFFAPLSSPWDSKAAINAISVQTDRPFPNHKTTDVGACEDARTKATIAGADEALLITSDSIVLEGAWSNFFWFNAAGALHTAAGDVLPGVIRRILIEEHECVLCEEKLENVLIEAREAFFTNSASGIMPLHSLDGRRMPESPPGPHTAALQEWLQDYTATRAEALQSGGAALFLPT